jgi:hypothetical protein
MVAVGRSERSVTRYRNISWNEVDLHGRLKYTREGGKILTQMKKCLARGGYVEATFRYANKRTLGEVEPVHRWYNSPTRHIILYADIDLHNAPREEEA